MAASSAARSSRALLLGLGVLIVFGISLYVAFIAARGLPFRSYTYVRAAFDDIGSLRPGDDVRTNSVRVGQVQKVEYVDGRAVATLQLDGRKQVYRDARASVAARSALGQKFVELDPGSPATGPLGDEVISAERTADARDLDYVFDALDEKTRMAVAQTLREAGGGLAGHGQDLHDFVKQAPDLLTDLGHVSAAAASDDAELVAMLRSADTLAGRFAGRQQEIATLIRQVDTTVSAVTVDGGQPLRKTLDQVPATLRSAEAALDALDRPLADTESAVRTLQPGAKALGDATPDLRGVLREAVPAMRKVPGVAEQAEPALQDLTRTVKDARPLAPRVAVALARARTPLQVLAPYSPEVALWFTYARDALKEGDAAGHWLRFDPLANTESVSGVVPVRDPVTQRNPYPAPGEAKHDRTDLPRGGAR